LPALDQAAVFSFQRGGVREKSRGNLQWAELSENATSALQRIVQPSDPWERKPAFTR